MLNARIENDIPLWISTQRDGWEGRENFWARVYISQLPDDVIPPEDRERISSGEWRYDRNSAAYAERVRDAIFRLTREKDPVTKINLAEIVDAQEAIRLGFLKDGLPVHNLDPRAVFNQYADTGAGYEMTPVETAKTIISVIYPQLKDKLF